METSNGCFRVGPCSALSHACGLEQNFKKGIMDSDMVTKNMDVFAEPHFDNTMTSEIRDDWQIG